MGCATSTIESRRKEKTATYETLSPELKTLVDKGQLKIGMPADAVYISWGAPSQVSQAEDAAGPTTTWLYQGSYLDETRFWNYREVQLRDGTFLEHYLDTDYSPRSFVRAEITFVNGVVKNWRTFSSPR
ncbi:MAG: hypothetical protein JWM68_273 [Verrucomicrobiales bacterium]|nr:hypothetical protein [Verrucomicrobiales bacterium]